MSVAQHNYFLGTVQYDKLSDEGKQEKVTDTYLVDSLSFTEAEARLIKEVTPYMTGEFTVSKIGRSRIYEIFENPNGDKWYKAKLLFIILDEDKGTEKKTAVNMLIQASDIQDALVRLNDGMKGTMSDYEVYSITDTPILEIFKYEA